MPGFCSRILIANGVDQVGFAEACTAVNEHRVIGGAAWVRCHLNGSGTGQVVGLTDDEVVEGEAGDQPRFLIIRARSLQAAVPLTGANADTGSLAGGCERTGLFAEAGRTEVGGGEARSASIIETLTGAEKKSAAQALQCE